MGVHVGGPGVGIVAATVRTVGDVALLELLHDGVVEFEDDLLLGGVGGDLVGEFDEAVEVVGLGIAHPAAAVHQRRLYHLQLFPRNHL